MLELGLLFGNEEEMMEEENEWLSFSHKIIHEYVAACYLVNLMAGTHEMVKQLFPIVQMFANLKTLAIKLMTHQIFPTWTDIKRHEEVYSFCIGCSLDGEQASLLIRHLCAVLSKTMIENMKDDECRLCYTGIYKIDTWDNILEEDKGHSDKAELTEVFSAISREARVHGNTCTNPACNEYIHVYPACRNTDPAHISDSKLIIFTDVVKYPQHSLGASDSITEQCKKNDKCLVIFGDNNNQQEFSCINHAMSHCNVTQVYMRACIVTYSVDDNIDQDVNNMFTQCLQSLCINDCVLPSTVWDKIGRGLAGSEAMKSVVLTNCTGVSKYLITCIASLTTLTQLQLNDCALSTGPCIEGLTTLTRLWLRGCKLSSEMCAVLCRQLIHLKHLEQLGLSGNPIGEHMTHITAAIKAWGPKAPLWGLYLRDCQLSANLVPALLSAVTQCCPLLMHLGIGENNIGGCLPSFMAAAPASLDILGVPSCNLQPEDVTSITAALTNKTLAQLRLLYLTDNSLSDSMVEPLLQAANTHHQGKLEVYLRDNNLSSELTTRWRSQCRPQLHLFLH